MTTDLISDAFTLFMLVIFCKKKNFPLFYICYLGEQVPFHDSRGQRSASRSQFSPSACGSQRPEKGLTVGTFTNRVISPALRDGLTVHGTCLPLELGSGSADCLNISCLCVCYVLLLPCSVQQAFWSLSLKVISSGAFL